MNAAQCTKLFAQLKQHNPAPTTELVYQTPFELLIAVILSAQATDVSVNRATRVLFKHVNTPEGFLKLGEAGLIPYIQSIGLYRTKAKHILKTCEQLVTHFDSIVPPTRAALEGLAGVGRKTANVILNTVFGEPTVAVDTHIFRVANRTGLARAKTPRGVEDKLVKIIPVEYRQDAHHWLVLHGRYVCTARKPHCQRCCIRDVCEYDEKTLS